MNADDDILDYLWSSIVEDFKFDLANHRIELQITTQRKPIEVKKNLRIDGVIGFFWVNGATSEGRLNTDPWDYADLFSAHTTEQSTVHVKGQFDDFGLKPNLVFEIWGSVLLIEAKEITMDGKSIRLMPDE